MKAVTLRKPPGIDSLDLVERDDPGAPGIGEIRVRVHASSLNYHDLGVVMGMLPTDEGRIPLSDGAGVVEAIGAAFDGATPDPGLVRELSIPVAVDRFLDVLDPLIR